MITAEHASPLVCEGEVPGCLPPGGADIHISMFRFAPSNAAHSVEGQLR